MNLNRNPKYLIKSKGILTYSRNWIIVEIDQGIMDYYSSLIPKYLETNKPRRFAHITVTRPEYETPPFKEEFWRKYEGEEIVFYYYPVIYNSETYYWLDCFSKRIEEIREELGFTLEALYHTPVEGFKECYHTTVANTK